MDTFLNAQNILNKRTSRKIDNNTYARLEEDSIYIRLHNTDIITVTQRGIVTLNSGGWRTSTPKERLNSCLNKLNLPARVSQERGQWYLYDISRGWDNAPRYMYADNMTIMQDNGTLIINGAASVADVRENEKRVKQIKGYVSAYVTALLRGDLSLPSAGDCFYCYMQDSSTGQSLGDTTRGTSHFELHIDEMYFVPSMLFNAERMYPMSIIAEDTCVRAMSGKKVESYFVNVTRAQVTSTLTRYLKHAFGIAS